MSETSDKLTLLTGAEKQEVDLKPSGDRLDAAGAVKPSRIMKIADVTSASCKHSIQKLVIKSRVLNFHNSTKASGWRPVIQRDFDCRVEVAPGQCRRVGAA